MDVLCNSADVIFKLLEDLNTPRCLTVFLLLKNKEYGQLVTLDCDPKHYNNADSYHSDVIATDLLRKCKGLPTGIDTRKAALESFFSSEEKCCRTNIRFSRHLNNGPFQDPNDLRVHEFLMSVKKLVSRVLGRVPSFIDGRFGPGATFGDRGQRSTVPDKMTSQPTVSVKARDLLPLWFETAWSRELTKTPRSSSDPLTVRGNRFVTVPKTAKTDRGIAVEPSINTWFQLGVGSHLRERLRRIGIDLNSGQDHHRLLAREASIQRHLATLDLSSASDTICTNLVKLLLPEDWFELLFCLRSPTTLVDGKTVVLEKFSSMGNGFTFELETVIFYCISQCVADSVSVEAKVGQTILVYGDDIIVPIEVSRPLIAALEYCGFSVNTKKTFISGNFRESCGGDFFGGVPVRAHFLKEIPHEPQHFIAWANGIRRLAFTSGLPDPRFRRAWFACLNLLPSSVRSLRGPESLGDLVIHDYPEFWVSRVRSSIREVATWHPVKKVLPLTKWNPYVQFAAALYGIPSIGVSPRGGVTGYRKRWVACS